MTEAQLYYRCLKKKKAPGKCCGHANVVDGPVSVSPWHTIIAQHSMACRILKVHTIVHTSRMALSKLRRAMLHKAQAIAEWKKQNTRAAKVNQKTGILPHLWI